MEETMVMFVDCQTTPFILSPGDNQLFFLARSEMDSQTGDTRCLPNLFPSSAIRESGQPEADLRNGKNSVAQLLAGL